MQTPKFKLRENVFFKMFDAAGRERRVSGRIIKKTYLSKCKTAIIYTVKINKTTVLDMYGSQFMDTETVKRVFPKGH